MSFLQSKNQCPTEISRDKRRKPSRKSSYLRGLSKIEIGVKMENATREIKERTGRQRGTCADLRNRDGEKKRLREDTHARLTLHSCDQISEKNIVHLNLYRSVRH